MNKFDYNKLFIYFAEDVMHLKKLFAISLLTLFMVSCSDILNVFNDEDPNELGGNTDLELTKVGNEYGVYIKLNDKPLNLKTEAKIVENDNGIITIRIKINLDNLNPMYKAVIPEEYLDANGNVDTKIKYKVTSEGIQDFYHSKQDVSKPFTIVKYANDVGTKYTFKREDGRVVTREITAKSTEDDFPLGYMLIKTITVVEVHEGQTVTKVIYYTNHKFGLVHVKLYFKDGFEASIDLIPWAVM